MYEYEYSVETTATPETIYQLWQDVSTWSAWDKSVAGMELYGPFAAGTKGKMTLVDQGPMDFTLIEVKPNVGFMDETPVPDAGISVIFNHILTPLENGRTRVTWQVKIVGPAAEEVGPQIGPMITSDTPEAVASLIALAEGVRVH